MRKLVFDIETKNSFQEVGKNDPTALDISLLVVYDYTTDAYTTYDESNFRDLWKLLEETDQLIGYNSDYFDVPLLNKYYPGDLTTISSLDLLKEIRLSLGRSVRLDAVADATLGEKKSGNGLEAIEWWRNGEIKKIEKYCRDDVRITKNIYEYALEHKSLKCKELLDVREFPIDTSQWDTQEANVMNYTLGI